VTFTVTRFQNRTVHRQVLSNGIVLLVTENPSADIISARCFMGVGGRWDSREQVGLSHLVGAVMTKGTVNHTSFALAEQVEAVGASLGTDSAADYFLISVKTVSQDFGSIFALAADVIRFPTFPESQVELERKQALQAIRSQQEQPFNVAMDHLRRTMYGDHPYAISGLGTVETVEKLTREDLCQYHRTYFRPDSLVISMAGRITPEEALTQVEKVFGDWARPQMPKRRLNLAQVISQPQKVVEVRETQQSVVVLGYHAPAAPVGVSMEDQEAYAALKLLNTYLGSGLSSRLFVELREKRGLAYEVSAFYPTRQDGAQFGVYIGTAPQNTVVAMEGLRQQIDRLKETPLSPEEIQISKQKLLGQYALGKQTCSQLAQVLGWYETLGLGVTFDETFQAEIAAVSAEGILRTAAQYFGEPYLSVLGPELSVAGI
jgi:zinc protease